MGMTYQVLARRFRPQRFEDLVGQDVVVRTLKNALASGQIAHAYLFSGLRGVGKTTAARLLAKALNCEQGPTAEPCGECVACREIAGSYALDVIEMDAASNRGIDDVRELREVARVLPVRDRYRVFIIDEAHQLTDPAFNALLKILEEPPAHVVFVLASTEKDKFPATILSRCQQLDFRPIPEELIVERIGDVAAADGFTLAPEAAQLIARAADGSLRDALSLLDRVRAFGGDAVDEHAVAEVLGLPPQEAVRAIWQALAAGDAAAAVALVREQERIGRDPGALYDALLQLLEALLLLGCDAEAPVPFAASVRAELLAATRTVGVPLMLRLVALALEQRGLVAGAERPGLAVAVAIGCSRCGATAPRRGAARRRRHRATAGAHCSRRTAGASVGRRGSDGPPGWRGRFQAGLGGADGAGMHMLAGRVQKAREVVQDGESLVVRFGEAPPATVQSLRDALQEIGAAARAAGLPGEVRVEAAGSAEDNGPSSLRQRVEADEAVRRVTGLFGGRLGKIEEKP
jgi:DNA polymerase-3 subunit gamma/tau